MLHLAQLRLAGAVLVAVASLIVGPISSACAQVCMPIQYLGQPYELCDYPKSPNCLPYGPNRWLCPVP
jgi:hypothetical protein